MTAPTDDRSGRAAPKTGAAGLSPAERLRRRSDYLRVYESGRKVHGRFMTLFVLPRTSAPSRLGIAATRKLGGAVLRNRARRRVREIFRHHRPLTPVDLVIVPKREFVDASFESLVRDFTRTFARLARGGTQDSSGDRA